MTAIFKTVTSWLKKQSAINKVLVTFYSGQPVWTRPRFEEWAEAGYVTNVYVYRCVNVISQACAGIPWLLYNKRGKLREIDKSPLLDLLARPNPYQGQAQFIESVIAYLLLAGNSYIEKVGPNSGVPKELYSLRPDRMYVVGGDRLNPILGYEFKDYGQTVKFTYEQILHMKTFSPLDYWYGLSPVRVADRSVVANNAAKAWNVSLLQNAARPSGALVTEQDLSDQETNRLKRQLDERYQGVINAGRPLLLSGGLDWKQMSLTPSDMDWLAGMKLTAKEIAITFGVPPELIGDSESKTYSNYQQARQAFYTETVLPLMDWLRDELNNWLTPLFGDTLYLDYDRDSIEAIQEDRQIVWGQAIEALKAGLLTTDEARELIGYEAFPKAHNETQPVDTELPANILPEDKAYNLRSNQQKNNYWKTYDALRTTWQKNIKKMVSRRFKEEGVEVVKAVRSSPTLDSMAGRAVSKINYDAWAKLYDEIYTDTMETFGEFTMGELKSQVSFEKKADLETGTFSIWLQAALNFVKNVIGIRVPEVIGTTSNLIQEVISKSLIEGLSIDDTANKIAELYDDMSDTRAETIARTETLSASSAGSRFSAMATGLPLKKNWLATRDKRTRPSHKRIDGEEQFMNDLYSNGLMFPGDPSGIGSETVNCRCTEWYNVVE